MTATREWVEVGKISVDAGLCWIGDPCYCVTPDATAHPAETWEKFCAALGNPQPPVKQWNHKAGHPGLGVTVSTGYGDGIYPVSVQYDDEGCVAAVMVRFLH